MKPLSGCIRDAWHSAFFALLLILLSPLAEATQVFIWQASPTAPKILLVRKENETPESAVRRYLNSIYRHPELSALFRESPLSVSTHDQFSSLGERPMSGRVRTALIANQFSDMSEHGDRILRNQRLFNEVGSDVYVIALAADLGLSEQEAAEYRTQIAERFDLVVSLGGDDIDPSLYDQPKTFAAEKTYPTRDSSELSLIRAVKKRAQAFFLGICRGHQMGAIADGHTLHQDISHAGVGQSDDHIANLNATSGDTGHTSHLQTWHHIEVFHSFLSRILNGIGRYYVNSVHHQIVAPSDNAQSIPIAVHDSSSIEALQMLNGLGLSFQFHPEFPEYLSGNVDFSKMGRRIMKGVVALARLNRQRNVTPLRRCEAAFAR